jgi:hypothetical protein
MRDFKAMTNICIEIELRSDASTLKQLSLPSYRKLEVFNIPSCYKLCAISKQSERKLWCQRRRELLDRDVVAVVNVTRRGWLRFDHSKGGAGEAMVSVSNPSVDAPKLTKVVVPSTS